MVGQNRKKSLFLPYFFAFAVSVCLSVWLVFSCRISLFLAAFLISCRISFVCCLICFFLPYFFSFAVCLAFLLFCLSFWLSGLILAVWFLYCCLDSFCCLSCLGCVCVINSKTKNSGLLWSLSVCLCYLFVMVSKSCQV